MMERRNDLMRSDIFETEDAYLVDIDLPGASKDKIQAYVEDEYLTVEVDFTREETGKPVRRERYNGKCQRRYYVGDLKTEDLKATCKDGVLRLTIPKKAYEKAAEERKITIE